MKAIDHPAHAQANGILASQRVASALGGSHVYDYGENWRHKVRVEKIVVLDTPISRGVCIGGENACPPKDVGGPPGYEDFVAALANPNDPEHDELKEWIGGAFDPTAFDVAEVNQRLSQTQD